MILEKLNVYLADSGFITGPKLSIIDVRLYTEITTICVMFKREVPDRMSKLANWYDAMGHRQAIQEQNEKFKQLVESNNLYYLTD